MGPMLKAMATAALVALTIGCGGSDDPLPTGPAGKDGAPGPQGAPGAQGIQGVAGKDGAPGIAGKDAAGSGSRIKAQWLVSDDGARSFVGWIDSTTGARCGFAAAGDGKTRCIPIDAGLFVYADAACSTPVYAALKNQPTPPAYVTATPVYDAPIPRAYLKVGAPMQPLTKVFGGQDCLSLDLSNTALADGNFYAATVLQPDFFVAGSVVTDQ